MREVVIAVITGKPCKQMGNRPAHMGSLVDEFVVFIVITQVVLNFSADTLYPPVE